MSRLKVYIAPFDTAGNYLDYVDVTDDVDERSISDISKQIDGNDFDLGTYRPADLNLKLTNDSGRYSDVGSPETIFNYKRSNSKVRVTWEIENDIVQCGFAICGEVFLSEEVVIFQGLLSDDATKEDLKSLKINFKLLSYEDLFKRDIVDTADFSNGDTIQSVIYDILINADNAMNILTVDALDIEVEDSGGPITVGDKTDFENNTVDEALKKLLEAGNAILYLDDVAIKTKPRDPSAEVIQTFRGQASDEGIEDIYNIRMISSGLSRTFNFWSWKDYTSSKKNESSRSTYGTRKKEIGLDFITSDSIKDNILESFKDEFGEPKREMTITVPLNYQTIDLFLLDRVNMDYPAPAQAVFGEDLPIWGNMIWGDFWWPYVDWSLELTEADHFKIMGQKYNLEKETIELKLREI